MVIAGLTWLVKRRLAVAVLIAHMSQVLDSLSTHKTFPPFNKLSV